MPAGASNEKMHVGRSIERRFTVKRKIKITIGVPLGLFLLFSLHKNRTAMVRVRGLSA